jgi:probable metal-binding protein
MQSIHGHEVLQMMIASGEPYSTATLEAAIIAALAQMRVFIPARQKI